MPARFSTILITLAVSTLGTGACVDELDTADVEESITNTCIGAIDDEFPFTSSTATCNAAFSAVAGAAEYFCPPLLSWRASAEADCAAGRLRRYRVNDTDARQHKEWMLPFDFAATDQWVLESNFVFATTPQPGGDPNPLYMCLNNNNPSDDYLTRSATCNGNGTVRSWSGYTYAAGTPGTTPVYRCLRNVAPVDHYLSRDATCGGNTVEGNFGNVK